MYNIEEFPPQREPARVTDRPKPRAASATRSGSGRTLMPAIVLLAVAAAGLAGAWWLMDRRFSELQLELAEARTSLDAAHNSLQLLWSTTSRLDAAQGQRHDFLQDSISSVQSFVDSAVTRLWQSAYLDHETRLDQNVRRLLAHDDALAGILDDSRLVATRVDALFRENESQFADLQNTNQTLASLRATLTTLTGQIGDLESEVTLARTARAQTDLRVDGFERWAVTFREAGLTGPVVHDRLADLDQELLATRRRVDALKAVTDSLTRVSAPTRVGATPGNL